MAMAMCSCWPPDECTQHTIFFSQSFFLEKSTSSILVHKFPLFFYIKSPDDESLKQLVPTVWWSTTNNIDQVGYLLQNS